MNTLVGLGALSSFAVSTLAAFMPKLVKIINKPHMWVFFRRNKDVCILSHKMFDSISNFIHGPQGWLLNELNTNV